MCGRFESLTKAQIDEVIDEVEGKAAARNAWPAKTECVVPSQEANVIVASGNALACDSKRWGFDNPRGSGLVFNSRIERVLAGEGMWGSMAMTGRCIVPAVAFYEPHRTQTVIVAKTGRNSKAQYRFFSASKAGCLLMAGLSSGDRFSVVTTEPDDVVSPVHDRMPLLLTPDAALEWMRGDWQRVLSFSSVSLAAEQELLDAHEQQALF